MSVSEVLQGAGRFEVALSDQVPRSLLDTVSYFGHVAIVAGRVDPVQLGDNILDVARYVGVVRGKQLGDSIRIDGGGMVLWLGDEDDKGDVLENAVTPTSATFANTVRALLPVSGSITEGTLHSVSGTYTGRHQWETPRKAITYVCDTFGAEYRVNPDGTLDAGLVDDLYVTTPVAIIVRHGAGRDMDLAGLPGSFQTDRDVEDFTTRVVLIAQGEGDSVATGSASINPSLNPYKDIHGNTVVRTRMISESDTSTGNAAARAQLQLNRFTALRNGLRLSTDDYDIKGTFGVGDYVWVYDPDSGLYDTANEVTFRGQRINPIKLRVVETSWPVTRGMTVAYRAGGGTWHDLTDYVDFESGDTAIVVGDLSRALTSSGFQPVDDRVSVDTSVPAAPTLVTPFAGSVYLDARGFSRAQLLVAWNAPLNVDGSTVLDGDHYEIRYAVDTDITYPATWAQIASKQWNQLNTWQQPNAFPSGDWNVVYAAWGESSVLIQDLSPGVGYDFQIRAVDTSGNTSAWSSIATAIATPDNIPPSTPAAPSVAASRIAIQVTHDLGKASGGTFNLESDLDHLDIHVDVEPTFLPTDSTRVGRLRATGGMIQAEIPAVGTFQVEETSERWVKVVAVDQSGNRSLASEAANSTALLIDDAHISDLTVTKVTAGTISANWLLGASIRTAATGPRVELNNSGIQAYNAAGTQTFDVDAATGDVDITGIFRSGTTGHHLVINPLGPGVDPEIRFYDSTAEDEYHFITAFAAAETTLQLGTVHDGDGDKGILNLDPAATFVGIVRDPGASVQFGLRIQDDGTINFTGNSGDAGVSYNGGALHFKVQSGPGNGFFRCFWNGTNIQFVRQDTNGVVKTFIADHPLDPDRHLVHATTESPANGVEYWGSAVLDADGQAVVELPGYFEDLTTKEDRVVLVSAMDVPDSVAATYPKDGRFVVTGTPCRRVSWLVKAVRADVPPLMAEPLRADVEVYGDGPYRYYVPREPS